jgi:hypothetical protein
LAWDEDKFWNATPSYFFKALKGFNDLEFERDKGHWERLRILGFWVVTPHAKKGSIPSAESLLSFPWDNKLSWKERNKEILEQCDRIIEKHG